MRVIDDPPAIVEAIFDFYEARGFTPTRAERDRMLTCSGAAKGRRAARSARIGIPDSAMACHLPAPLFRPAFPARLAHRRSPPPSVRWRCRRRALRRGAGPARPPPKLEPLPEIPPPDSHPTGARAAGDDHAAGERDDRGGTRRRQAGLDQGHARPRRARISWCPAATARRTSVETASTRGSRPAVGPLLVLIRRPDLRPPQNPSAAPVAAIRAA